ncbi:MAG: exodeoxyribonuclease VII large subunit [Paludibacterium sp.]|uniref:exodeoxyribonuclease VII large subunit n=1 Tax=Paludibacterium sp. TaxID=1917523 RepID=UPI0025D387E5|nr:exodeoxyribonuclease VII large subunit [Paludibacterium sp.]MBV8046378.1 exodeoxyribonuclease VII large subunit [Paludibacterium sp.]MBV8646275.1 exodeoxyribonuclease VII large subunit [Paludibacterium sp.]
MSLSPSAPDVISVSALNRLARDLLESGLPAAWIGGEVSNLTVAASGHAYFSLKDATAQARCVMFRNRLSALPFKLANGLQVELRGLASLYEARGEFQINVETVRAAGLGRLFEAFERLKAQLAAEGLFAAERKRPIPHLPRAIGIVTSPAAAALRDVVTTLTRRMPGLPLILYPTPVQGDGAAQQIAAAINQAGARREVDVLIVCRGGGSIEDLWAFNEEAVARAVSACPLPVISGVGHETDFTICDFAADLRAPTPTAAAELAAPSREQLQRQIDQARQALQRATARQLNNKTQQLDLKTQRLRHPGERLKQQAMALDHARAQLQQRMQLCLQNTRMRLGLAQNRFRLVRPDLTLAGERLAQQRAMLVRAMSQTMQNRRQTLARHAALLASYNPQAVLARGYAIVQTEKGEVVKSAANLRQGQRLQLQLAEGRTEALVDHRAQQQPELPF